MADDFFKKVQKAARKEGVKGTSLKARNFFRQKVKELGKGVTAQSIIRSRPDRLVGKGNLAVGKMYFFLYDAKLKNELPYWDRFPLIFVLRSRNTTKRGKGKNATGGNKGFMGLNLHYLPPKTRALFFSKLMELSNNSRFDETTKLKLTYQLLKNAAKLKEFKPTIKQYLNAHVKSRFLLVPADDWLAAVFLPVADFQKASSAKVWADSRKKIAKK